MAQVYLNIFIFVLIFLMPTVIMSKGFKVIQPPFQDVNTDKTASISCEHDAENFNLRDVRLNLKKPTGTSKLCQKGMPSCPNIIQQQKTDRHYVFTLKNVGLEQMKFTYECEITLEINDLDLTATGEPTQLLYNFNVNQPQFQDVNPDQTASISCQHDAEESTVQEVGLYRISQEIQEKICQIGTDNCTNIVAYQENSKKFVFILLNVGPEEMKFSYQCEINVKLGNVNNKSKGKPTKLKQVKDCPSNEAYWILIGLLSLMFLYGCVITCFFVRVTMANRKTNGAGENSTYVIMKPPPPNNQYAGIYEMHGYQA
ncbi:uncharacterized protein LOC119794080 isoform X2 [Cyprinodon tularosa]|uniref:uncharacterized protein LOC119794080 isoform X2 n=1 Tax=Cyprinodon tularosa TaxID=77115 RepID=UPI0018E1DDE9|nr:uncharacterized protein LOC119794080 isoform X2 [Cyprinodon tularosa]